MTADDLVNQALLDGHVFLGALIADERQTHPMDIEALDMFQVELRDR